MKKAVIFLALMLSYVFSGCGKDSMPDYTEAFIPETSATVTVNFEQSEEAPKILYSPLAKEQFLEPLEDFSWEREFAPEYVMIHFTSAVLVSKDDPYNVEKVREIFTDSGVSIHYIIDRDGGVYCYIPETRAAWHAGKGTFADDERLTNAMNKYSVGIELIAIGSKEDMSQYLTDTEYEALDDSLIGFTDAQYESLAALVRDICDRNDISFDRDRVIGHEEYNPVKSDPGELFDWDRLFAYGK